MTPSQPTVFWFIGRGTGFVAMILLTASVAYGVATTVRYQAPRWPRFINQGMHRSISLLAMVFLVIHIITVIIDPFAQLSLRDAVLPFGAAYRAVWLALGVVAFELMLALIITSLVRHRLGYRAWRWVHWTAYLSWPLALLHGMGTGSDTKSVWGTAITIACIATVAGTVAWRLRWRWPEKAGTRVLTATACVAGLIALAVWSATGPYHSGWARTAGTPPNLLASSETSPPAVTGGSMPAQSAAPAAAGLAAGLNDQLSGQIGQSQNGGTQVDLQDQTDPSIAVQVLVSPDQSQITVSVTRSGAVLCSGLGRSGDDGAVDFTCGSTAVSLSLSRAGERRIDGTLSTS